MVITANVVAALLGSMAEYKITSMTLLPGAVETSKAVNTPTRLGPDTIGRRGGALFFVL